MAPADASPLIMGEQFTAAAEAAFEFLSDAGYRLTERAPTHVTYESAKAFLTVTWDARSGELNVFVGLQPRSVDARDSIALGDLLGMEDVDTPERKQPFQVANESRLGKFLNKLAEATRIHAQPALAGDRMYFRRLQAFRNRQSRAYMQEMDVRRVRSEAEGAWNRRDLDMANDLFSSIEDFLTESERAKLKYARKHRKPKI